MISFFILIILSAHGLIYASDRTPSINSKNNKSRGTTKSFEQGDNIPSRLLKIVQPHIPSNHKILYLVEGDLNRDNDLDILLALMHEKEADASNTGKNIDRPLLLLVNTGNGRYRLAARNNKAIYCYSCGGVYGDPFLRMVVKNGYFTIEHYGGSAWRWTHLITFKYNTKKRNWFLHRVGGESYHTSNPDKRTKNMKTVKDFGIVPFNQYDIYKK